MSEVQSGALALVDDRDVADLETLLGRARTADREGAVRLQAAGTVLAVTVGLVPGSGLLGEGTVLGLRAMRLAEVADVDAVVSFEAMGDRLARMRRDSSTVLSVPVVEVQAPWAALSPPRTGWHPQGVLDVETVRACARDGVAEITGGAPEGSGAAAVAGLRRRVWGRPIAAAVAVAGPDPMDATRVAADDVAAPARRIAPVAGLAFGAMALGFLGTGPLTWHTVGSWQRLSTPAGHVLAR